MNKFWRYILTKVFWFLFAFAVALIFNFLLIRLIPGNPVDAMMARMSSSGGATSEAQQKIYAAYIAEFGLDERLDEDRAKSTALARRQGIDHLRQGRRELSSRFNADAHELTGVGGLPRVLGGRGGSDHDGKA